MSEYNWTKELNEAGGEPGFYDLTYGPQGPTGARKNDLPAKFEIHQELDRAASKEANRPIYREIEMVRVFMPGGDETCRAVQPEDAVRWPEQWDAFRKGQETPTVGTPLEMWAPINASVVALLKAKNVFSVENLAAISDAHCEAIGNFSFEWRDRAKAWLEQAQGDVTGKLQEENEALKAQMAEMQAAIKALQEKPKPKRRGRPVGSKNKAKPNVTANDDPGDGGTAEPAGS